MQLVTGKIERAPFDKLFPLPVEFCGRGPPVNGWLAKSALEGGVVIFHCFEGRCWDELAQARVIFPTRSFFGDDSGLDEQ